MYPPEIGYTLSRSVLGCLVLPREFLDDAQDNHEPKLSVPVPVGRSRIIMIGLWLDGSGIAFSSS